MPFCVVVGVEYFLYAYFLVLSHIFNRQHSNVFVFGFANIEKEKHKQKDPPRTVENPVIPAGLVLSGSFVAIGAASSGR